MKGQKEMERKESIKYCEDLLYEERNSFNFFENMSDEKSHNFEKKVYEFLEVLKKVSDNYLGVDYALNYENALCFLTSNHSLSFDEKIMFLIRIVDPHLEIYNIYKRYSNNKVRIRNGHIISLTKEIEEEFKQKVEQLFGFYSSYLVRYEELYLEHYLNKKRNLSKNVSIDYVRAFLNSFDIKEINLDIDVDELEAIIKHAEEYIKEYGIPSINDLLYQLKFEIQKSNMRSVRDKIIFLIYVLDSDMRYAKIYNSHYNLQTIKNEIEASCGSYNPLLLDLELKYIKDNRYIAS